MRLSLQRIVFYRPQQTNRSCLNCQSVQIIPFLIQNRGYADIVRDSDESCGVQSNIKVPDLDVVTAESLEIQQAIPLPESPPQTSSSPLTTTPTISGKQPPRFWLVKAKTGRERDLELRKLMSQTSLRKKISWSPPSHGINPAYDMAIVYLNQDRREKIKIIKNLERRIQYERTCTTPPNQRLMGAV